MIRAVDPAHISRLLNHGPTVLVSSAAGGRRNVMAAAWSMPVEFTPARVAVVVDKSTFSRELITQSGLLALNIPCRAQIDAVYAVGSLSGRDPSLGGQDKFERFGLRTRLSPTLQLPWVEGCVAWMEGRVLSEPRAESAYDTFFVEMVSAQADERVFQNGRWTFDTAPTDLHTLHHLGGGTFALPGEIVRAQTPA